MDKQTVATMTLVSTSQAVTVFTAMMPDLSDVRAQNNPTMKDSVRTAEITATVIAGTIGFGVSVATGSPTPFVVTLLVCGMLAATYEYVQSTTPPLEGKQNVASSGN